MNRALLKQDAKNAMSAANPHPVLTTLVLFAVSVASGMVISIFSGIFGFMGVILRSETIAGASVLLLMIVSILVSLLMGTVMFGYSAYCLKVFRHEDTGIGELFSYVPQLFKIFGLSLWITLFVSLWSFLCVIPGIIAALRYSQAFFIMVENPDKSIRECVNDSKMLMSGRLWEFFVLELSFILWMLLISVTCGIAYLYVQPYMTITFAGYYLSLKPDGGVPLEGFDSDGKNSAFQA